MKRTPLPPRKTFIKRTPIQKPAKWHSFRPPFDSGLPANVETAVQVLPKFIPQRRQIRRLFTFSAIPTIFQSHPNLKGSKTCSPNCCRS